MAHSLSKNVRLQKTANAHGRLPRAFAVTTTRLNGNISTAKS